MHAVFSPFESLLCKMIRDEATFSELVRTISRNLCDQINTWPNKADEKLPIAP